MSPATSVPTTRKRRRYGVYWVIVGPEPHFASCERCGGTIPKPLLPAPVKAVVLYTQYATELHRYCREQVPA